jgi:hypothetical protein
MTDATHVVGVDPGLVHTGVVRMVFQPDFRRIVVEHEAVAGPDADAVRDWVDGNGARVSPSIYIESYQPRHHFGGDLRMVAAVQDIRKATGGQVISNTGVKKVVRPALMQLLGVWSFGTVTHNQDLRAAARIALYGMLKQPVTNLLLADVVRDHLAGNGWAVRT